jgi:hypothetical protein
MNGNLLHIPNSIQLTQTPKELTAQIFILFQKDFSNFLSVVNFKNPVAICSVKSKSSKRLDLYEGICGYLYFLQRLVKSPSCHIYFENGFDRKDLIQSCQDLLDSIDPNLNGMFGKGQAKDRITFCTGDSGILAMCLVTSSITGNKVLFDVYYKKLIRLANDVILNAREHYCELLYGLPGLLHALLYVRKYLGEQLLSGIDEVILGLYFKIVEIGLENYKKIEKEQPSETFRLVYTFYKKEYIGGAHGLFGVLYTLIQALEVIINKLDSKELETLHYIFKSLDFCVKLQTGSGNFPSSCQSKKDTLVQFCHGAPGAIAPLLSATSLLSKLGKEFRQKYKEDEYLNSARRAASLVWKNGIILKGFGICHGISGNAYSLLEFTKCSLISSDERSLWSRKASHLILLKSDEKIMQAIANYNFEDRFVVGMSDYPYSLMLGLTGDLCLELDLLDGTCTYPGYDA